MSTKRSKIKVFDIFAKALNLLEEQDRNLYGWQRNRIAISHALAQHLHDLLQASENSFSVDLCPVLYKTSKILNPDILVHNRETENQILSVVCRNDYLTEQEQLELIQLRANSKCELVLGLSFLTQKNYMLIYVTHEDRIEYYHFDRNSLTIQPFKQRAIASETESKDQLTLDKLLRRR
ncbi:MAG: hypothetical protein MJ057_01340 [Sphaerochaetaceae bacterium]|nr:hypothetical protein [Sphaerochaetaceae bacterium]